MMARSRLFGGIKSKKAFPKNENEEEQEVYA